EGRWVSNTEPAGSRYLVTTGAPGFGTPGTAWSPSTRARPPSTGTSAWMATPVLPLRKVTVVTGSVASTSPSSTANGPTAVVRLPQLPDQSTTGWSTPTCANQYLTSSSPSPGSTTTSLLVLEYVPPSPSICIGSGLPMMSRTTASRSGPGGGTSLACTKTPLLVPPRISTAGSDGGLTR